MTMQLSGPISMGQAETECKISGQADASNALLSRLAGVASGSKYAWSYWYGKTSLPQYNNALYGAYTIYGRSRPSAVRLDLRNAGVVATVADGHINPGSATNFISIPDFTVYDYVSVDLVFYNPGDLDHPTGWCIYGSQVASNPWIDMVQWSQPGYGTATPINIYVTALSISGATSKTYTCNSWGSGTGAGAPPFYIPAYDTLPAQSFPDVFSYVGPYNAYQNWLNSQQDSGGSGGGSCFIAGSLVMMADRSWKPIETIESGDLIMGPAGPCTVKYLYESILGTDRSMLTFKEDRKHVWSDEHPHWARKDGKQWWWSANAEQVRREMEEGLVGGLKDPYSFHSGAADFAHLDGFVKRTPIVIDADPNTKVYIPVVEGSPCFINGYMVSAFINEYNYDYENLDWNQHQSKFKTDSSVLDLKRYSDDQIRDMSRAFSFSN